jgi:hypothetical protein
MIVLLTISAGDLKKGKKALRVTIEYNIPVMVFMSSLNTSISLLESWR